MSQLNLVSQVNPLVLWVLEESETFSQVEDHFDDDLLDAIGAGMTEDSVLDECLKHATHCSACRRRLSTLWRAERLALSA